MEIEEDIGFHAATVPPRERRGTPCFALVPRLSVDAALHLEADMRRVIGQLLTREALVSLPSGCRSVLMTIW
jgi:hypothetical protein